MRYFIIFLISFLAVIFQSSFLVHFPISGYVLNLSLILAVGILIFRNFKESLFFAFFSGLFLDFFSAGPFGLSLAVFIFCLILLNLFQKITKITNWKNFFIFLPVSLALYEALVKFLLWAISIVTK